MTNLERLAEMETIKQEKKRKRKDVRLTVLPEQLKEWTEWWTLKNAGEEPEDDPPLLVATALSIKEARECYRVRYARRASTTNNLGWLRRQIAKDHGFVEAGKSPSFRENVVDDLTAGFDTGAVETDTALTARNGDTVGVHRFVLFSRCAKAAGLQDCKVSPAPDGVFLKRAIRGLYTGRFECEDCDDAIQAVNTYTLLGVPWLLKSCVDQLSAFMTTENIAKVLVCAIESDIDSLVEQAGCFFWKNHKRARTTDAWEAFLSQYPALEGIAESILVERKNRKR